MIASILLATSLIVVCGLALILSMYAGMITDECSVARRCSESLINASYLATWGGIGAAVLITLAGMGVSAHNRSIMLIWRRWAGRSSSLPSPRVVCC